MRADASRARISKRGGPLLLAVAAALIGALTATAPAGAVVTHLFERQFCEAGTGPGEEEPCRPAFARATKLALDQSTGDVLVADRIVGTVSRYRPDGAPANFSALGTNVIDGAGGADATPEGGLGGFGTGSDEEVQIAVDNSGGPSEGNIYVTQNKDHLVDIFSSGGAYLGQLSEYDEGAEAKPFGFACGVAVDPAGGVYVGDPGPDTIHRYLPAGAFPVNGDWQEDLSIGLEDPCNLAAGAGPSAGYLFVDRFFFQDGFHRLDLEGPGEGEVKQVTTGGVGDVAVDPASGHVYAAKSTEVFEYEAAGATPGQISKFNPPASGSVRGMAIEGASGTVYTAGGGPNLEVFGPTVKVPTTTTQVAFEIEGTSATLRGRVNPDGLLLEDCFFEYGTTSAYGQSAPCEPAAGEIPADEANHQLTAHLAGLDPATTYHYRLVAPGPEGSLPGADGSFTTKPFAITKAPSEVKGTSARLNGEANPFEEPLTDCYFEYGTTTEYSRSVPCEPAAGEIPADASYHPLSAQLTGLDPGTVHHYRLVVENAAGTLPGKDEALPSEETVLTDPSTQIEATAATLNGSVDPDGVGIVECFFEYGTTSEYGQSAPCEPAAGEIPADDEAHAVSAQLGGLNAGTTYRYRLVVLYAGEADLHPGGPLGRGAEQTVQTLGPAIEATWARSVGHTEARIQAEIDPEGAPTSYRFEYGTDESYGSSIPVPDGQVGEDSEAHLLGATLEGLTPGVTYHYRAVAANECEPAEQCVDRGPDRTLTTYRPLSFPACANEAFRAGPAATLPDCRAYEMVSPLDKGGGDIGALSLTSGIADFTQAAVDGERITYSSNTAFGDAERGSVSNQYLSTRGAGGWSTHGLNPPQRTTIEDPGYDLVQLVSTFRLFTPDLCAALLIDENLDPLDPAAIHGYDNLYLRRNCGPEADTYAPVTVGGPPPSAFRAPRLGIGLGVLLGPDGCHVGFGAEAALGEDAAPSTGPLSESQVYARDLCAAGTAPVAVSRLPSGKASGTSNVLDAIAADGAAIYWTKGPVGKGGDPRPATVYVRLNPTAPETSERDGEGDCLPDPALACTLAVSGPVDPSPQGSSRLQAASPDGSLAILNVGAELYEFDLGRAIAGEAALTKIAGGAGAFVLASTDLARVYFSSTEALAPGAVAGKRNVYLREGGTEPRLVATIADNFSNALASPDGRFLAFSSTDPDLAGAVAGFDNTDQSTGEGAREVYRYDASAEALGCISCNPSGARPSGGARIEWIAADGGRAFFESEDALVPGDVNGTDGCAQPGLGQPPSCRDVYQWEAPGKGGCGPGGTDFFASSEGCLDLVSTGRSGRGSSFYGAGEGGRDAFLLTDSSIDPRDPGSFDVYDAREGGGFAPPPAPRAECAGDSCQSPPPAPAVPPDASAAFGGPGNLPPGCGPATRRAAALTRRAKRARRAARHASGARAKHLRSASRRLAAKAKRARRGAKRCRAAARRAER